MITIVITQSPDESQSASVTLQISAYRVDSSLLCTFPFRYISGAVPLCTQTISATPCHIFNLESISYNQKCVKMATLVTAMGLGLVFVAVSLVECLGRDRRDTSSLQTPTIIAFGQAKYVVGGQYLSHLRRGRCINDCQLIMS